jgi:hypothetical protein
LKPIITLSHSRCAQQRPGKDNPIARPLRN